MKVLNILIRRCVLIARFEETVSFYEHLISQKARLRFDYPEYDLKLAQVGSVLLIGGTEQSLAPFRATEATFLVNDITAWEKHLPSTGATIINPVKAVPTGWVDAGVFVPSIISASPGIFAMARCQVSIASADLNS